MIGAGVNGTHEALCQAVHDRVLDAVQALPNPGGLTADALRAACAEDASFAEGAALNSLFLWLIPGLVTNVAFFRRQFATD